MMMTMKRRGRRQGGREGGRDLSNTAIVQAFLNGIILTPVMICLHS
jgi:hypothetical protein